MFVMRLFEPYFVTFFDRSSFTMAFKKCLVWLKNPSKHSKEINFKQAL